MKALNLSLIVIALAAMLVMPQSSEAAARVYVRFAPPKHKVVVVKANQPGKIWNAGHWNWNGKKYVWVNGHYVSTRAGHVHIQGHWAHSARGWYWVPGHWKRI